MAKIILSGTNGDEPDDIRINSGAASLQIQRVYIGSELMWDYESSAGRVMVHAPKAILGVFGRVPGRSVLPILARRTASVIARVPTVDARRAVTVNVPRIVISITGRIPADVVDLRAATIYPTRALTTLNPRLPVVTPRRVASISVPRAIVSLTSRVPTVQIVTSATIGVPRVLINLTPRIPADIIDLRSVTIYPNRATANLTPRLPVADPRRVALVSALRALISLTSRVPVITIPPVTTPMSMNKSGSQSISSTTPTQVTGWVADGAYPGTAIVSNRLVVAGSGNYNILSQLTITVADSSPLLSIWINGVSVTSYTASATAGLKVIPSILRNLINGDTVEVRARKGASADDAFSVSATNSYLRLVPIESPVVPSGLTLGTAFEATPVSTWVPMVAANWAATWASYPSTLDSGNGFEVQESGNVQFRLRWSTNSSSTTYSRGMQVLINGVVAYTFTAFTQDGDTTSGTIAVSDGDIVTFECITSGSTASQRSFTTANTMVEMLPV